MGDDRIEGTVSRVILTRGFGFIVGDDGIERFMLYEQVIPIDYWEKMRQGQRVSFRSVTHPKGERAVEIRPC